MTSRKAHGKGRSEVGESRAPGVGALRISELARARRRAEALHRCSFGRWLTVSVMQMTVESGGGREIRTPKGLAARWISSPLPCQLRLALRGPRLRARRQAR